MTAAYDGHPGRAHKGIARYVAIRLRVWSCRLLLLAVLDVSVELRRLAAEKIVIQLLGPDWRADRPLETMGGLIGRVVEGVPSFDKYREAVGEIRGLKAALGGLDQSVREMNEF